MRAPRLPAVSPVASLTVALLALSGCRFGAEGTFTAGAAYDACDGSIPVCNTTASCKLVEEDGFTDGEFPGLKQLIIPTAGEAIIDLSTDELRAAHQSGFQG